MKFIIRSGKVRGRGEYWIPDLGYGHGWFTTITHAYRFDGRERAREEVLNIARDTGRDARIVRLLSHEEAKRKFAAGVLREMAGDAFGLYATDLRMKADELWPVKGKR